MMAHPAAAGRTPAFAEIEFSGLANVLRLMSCWRVMGWHNRCWVVAADQLVMTAGHAGMTA